MDLLRNKTFIRLSVSDLYSFLIHRTRLGVSADPGAGTRGAEPFVRIGETDPGS